MLGRVPDFNSDRPRIVFALIAFVVAVCSTVAAATGASYPAAKGDVSWPSRTGSATVAVTEAGQRLQLGLDFGDTLTWMSDQDLAAGLNDAVALGTRWIRTDLSWADIQPSRGGAYQWWRYDRVINAARARGLTVLPTIGYAPAWAGGSNCRPGQNCPPANPADFAAFAAAVAKRYAPEGVHTWEIWNEPNISLFWQPGADAAAYTELLRDTSGAIRAVDPKAFLIMGGLAAVKTNKKVRNESATQFLAEVSALGGNKLVQAIGYHPYTYPYLPGASTAFGTTFERISSYKDNLVAVLDRYGTPDMPVWITETGAPTDGPGAASDGKNIPNGTDHVTEARQAQIAADTVAAASANRHVGAVFWFADKDSALSSDISNSAKFFGLRHLDGTPKPSFAAFKRAVAAYLRQPG